MLSTTLDPTNRLVAEVLEQRWNEKVFRGRAPLIRDLLKVERLSHRRYLSREKATQDVFQSIEVFYHRQRRHFILGYRSPAELEAMLKPVSTKMGKSKARLPRHT